MALEASINEQNVDGEWNSVVKGGKGGKKQKGKKYKNARTLTLQTFFSEHGGLSPDYGPSMIQTMADKDQDYKSYHPDLSEDERVVQNSLLSFFGDLLRRLGPVKKDDLRIKSELEAVSDEGQRLIRRYSTVAEFLSQDEDIVVVDDYICTQTDKKTAQDMAMKLLIEKMESIKSICPKSPPNVWNTKAPPANNFMDPILQLPEVESLFNYSSKIKPIKPPASSSFSSIVTSSCTSSASVITIPNSFPIPPPPLMTSPPPPTLIKAPNLSSLSNGHMITDSFSSSSSSSTLADIESLSKRLQGLAACNADLIKQLSEKDKQIQTLTKLIDPQYDIMKKNISLDKELQEAKMEIALLKSQNHQFMSQLSNTPNDSSMILSLQKQLESEKQNSRNLRHQVEMERMYSTKVNEKHNNLVKQLHMTSTSPVPNAQVTTSSTSLTSSVIGSSRGDSLGLRGILANAGSKITDLEPSSSTSKRMSLFSSSAGSALLPSSSTSSSKMFSSFSSDFNDSFFNSLSSASGSASSSTLTSSTKSGSGSSGFEFRSPFL